MNSTALIAELQAQLDNYEEVQATVNGAHQAISNAIGGIVLQIMASGAYLPELQRLARDYETMAESASQLMAEIYDTAMDFRDSIPLYDTDTLEL